MIETIASLFILATLVEGLIQYFVSNTEKPQPWLMYVSAVLGIAVCVAYKADLFAALGLVSAYPIIGQILTGFVIGRGSNYLNDFVTKVRNPTVLVAETAETAA